MQRRSCGSRARVWELGLRRKLGRYGWRGNSEDCGSEQPWNRGEKSSKNDRRGTYPVWRLARKAWEPRRSPRGVHDPREADSSSLGSPQPSCQVTCAHAALKSWSLKEHVFTRGATSAHYWESQMSPVKHPLNRSVRRFLSQKKSHGYFLFSSLHHFSSDIPFLHPKRNAHS